MKHAEVAGGRIRWVELPGAQPARVYLHGLGNSSLVAFGQVAAHPALVGRRSLLIDMLGYGISDRPASFGYSLREHADSIAVALDRGGVCGTEVVAHSMGGAVAIVLATVRPDLVSRLVVAEANLDPTERPRIAGYTEDEFATHGFAKALANVDPEWAATMRLADPVALYRSEVALGRGATPRVREMLIGLDMPKTFLLGARSGELEGRTELEASGVRVITVPDAGHTMMFDNPDGFATALFGALRG
jgi:pimeloyl-ACP methyl ester carboxylesterase